MLPDDGVSTLEEKNAERVELDELDQKIIDALRVAPQSTNADLARKLRVAKTTVGLRIGRLTSGGVLRIMGATNPVKVGYTLSAWVLIQSRGRKVDEVGGDLTRIPEAVAVGSLTGNYALYTVLMARDTQHLTMLLEDKIGTIKGITRVDTYLVLDLLKYRTDLKAFMQSDGGVQARLREIELTDLKDTHDSLDRHLLAEFQNDGRVTYRDLSRRYKVPESTVRARSRRLEKKGEIVYMAATNPVLMGFSVVAFIFIRATLARVRPIAEELSRKEHSNAVLITIGQSDILCLSMFRTQDEMNTTVHEWLPALDGVDSVEVVQGDQMYKQLLGWARILDVKQELSKSKTARGRKPRKQRTV